MLGRKTALVLLLLLVLEPLALMAGHGADSCEAQVFVVEDLLKGPAVLSPDHKLAVRLSAVQPKSDRDDIETGIATVESHKQVLGRIRLHNLSAGIFVKWAPDSKAFYIMWSDGGMIGGYHVRVFKISEDRIAELQTLKSAFSDFSEKHRCVSRGTNQFALKWENDSSDLLVAFQIYPTSDCGRQMGVTRGYLVAADSGEILKTYKQKQIKEQMASCPSKIWPTAFWNSDDLRQTKSGVAQRK